MNQFLKKTIGLAALACAFSGAALADLVQTTTLQSSQNVNMDTGATSSSGGDIRFTGTSVRPVNAAMILDLGPQGSAGYNALSQATLSAFPLATFNQNPISGTSLAVNEVFAVYTNGQHYAKALITAVSGSSVTIQFTTFVAGGGAGAPTISRVTNNSSDIPGGLPNSGISQGALFKIVGSGLADDGDPNLHDSQAPGGLPLTLNNAQVKVTVGATTVNIALYYATPTQIDGVLPANTPTGSGTLVVTYKGVSSTPFTIVVVAAAPGITIYQNGTAVAQDTARPNDPYGGLITFTKSAAPGAIIVIWGSGFGPTSDSDTAYTGSPHATSVSYAIYIGGVQVTNIAYAGRSVYPGVSVFVLTIPQNAPQGCYVPTVAVSTVNGVSTASNTATLPIHAGGGVCSDPQYGTSGDQLSGFGGQGTVKVGSVSVTQVTQPTLGTTTSAGAFFFKIAGASFAGGQSVSIGGCIVIPATGNGSGTGSTTGLNAGNITLTGPGSGPVALTASSLFPGLYTASIGAIPANGGSYVFNGSGGADVGSFSATVNFTGSVFTWTNQNAAATVSRSGGLTVTWSGGVPGTYVTISGSSFTTGAGGTVTGIYVCIAPQAAGSFTVPSYILLSLPAGNGSTALMNNTIPVFFSANGIDFGTALGQVQIGVTSNYN